MRTFDADAARPSEAADGPSPARERWQCLECDYSLAFTTEDRCPECGAAFTPADMEAMHAGVPIPTYPWEGAWAGRWFRMCELVLTNHEEFCGRMSLVPNGDAAAIFALTSYIVAAAIVWCGAMICAVLVMMAHEPSGPALLGPTFFGFLFGGGIWLVGVLFCDSVIIAILAAALRPRGRLHGHELWRTIVFYHAAHAPLSSLLIAGCAILVALGAMVRGEGDGLFEFMLMAGIPIGGGCAMLVLGAAWISNVLDCARRFSRPTPLRPVVLAFLGCLMLVFFVCQTLGAILIPLLVTAMLGNA